MFELSLDGFLTTIDMGVYKTDQLGDEWLYALFVTQNKFIALNNTKGFIKMEMYCNFELDSGIWKVVEDIKCEVL